MPEIGEITNAKGLGRKGWGRYIWSACAQCGKGRWIRLRNSEPAHLRCRACDCRLKSGKGEDNIRWSGGKHKTKEGYIALKFSSDDFFFPTAQKWGYILEHRLVMAKHLGRNLHPWEIVHHIGTQYPSDSIENRSDNRIENLQIVSELGHTQITLLGKRISRLEAKVDEQKKQIRLLQWQIKEISANKMLDNL